MAASPVMAMPELNTGALYDYLAPMRSTFTKRIINLGNETAFVRVEVAEIIYDAKGDSVEQVLQGADRPLIASPGRLIVPAEGSRDIRLVYRGARATERYFRLRFVPVVPAKDDTFGLGDEERAHYREAIEAQVGVLKAIGGVVLVEPSPTRFDTRLQQREGEVRVTNEGNTTVRLEDFSTYHSKTGCGQGRTVHVRPGQAFIQTAAPSQRFCFTLVEGSQRTRHQR